jgi:DNA-directed RNA polymerase subunit RPC12/RpoP
MKTVTDGCPYCGSKEGFEQKETVTRYLYFDSKGEPNDASGDSMNEKMSWQYPRCVKCHRRVVIRQ